MGTGIRLGPIERKLLTHSCFLYWEQQIYLNLWSVDILSIIAAEQISLPDLQIACLLRFEKLYADFKTEHEANVIVLK